MHLLATLFCSVNKFSPFHFWLVISDLIVCGFVWIVTICTSVPLLPESSGFCYLVMAVFHLGFALDCVIELESGNRS